MVENWNIDNRIAPMLTGEDLNNELEVLPSYDKGIRTRTPAERLMALNDIYSFYKPSHMSHEIYTKIYLAMVRSFQKKGSKIAMKQRNQNANAIKSNGSSFGGVIGGCDCFSIIGSPGIGKSRSIERAVSLAGGENVIDLEKPYCKIIPIINVQCPFDCSAKAMLLSICKKIDEAIGSSYYEMEVRARASTNVMIVSVAQVLLNHCAVLVIDEIQNLVKHRAGVQLVAMLTELLNESGISIIMVGTPEVESFFSGVDYLARRTIGLRYDKCAYDDYWYEFCYELWKYQYVTNQSELSDSILHYLYEHSAGTISHVLFLFHTAQEISILNGRECLDMAALEEAYQRMRMLHTHIEPDISLKKKPCKRKKKEAAIEVNASHTTLEEIPVEKCETENWSFEEYARISKKKNVDMALLLKGKISITELVV